jgi:hypothetical protein
MEGDGKPHSIRVLIKEEVASSDETLGSAIITRVRPIKINISKKKKLYFLMRQ